MGKVWNRAFKNAHVYVINIDNKAARQVTKGVFSVSSLSWSPDGEQIVVAHRPTLRAWIELWNVTRGRAPIAPE